MACGKTTLGRALAAAGHARFVDLDELVEQKSGLSPAEWFASRGEAAFRQAEREALQEAIATPSALPLIIATGGGTASNDDSMELMLSAGRVVWLQASLERTIQRLIEADGRRPLVAGMDRSALADFLPTHLAQRLPFYRRAHEKFDSSRLDNAEEIAATVGTFVEQILKKS